MLLINKNAYDIDLDYIYKLIEAFPNEVKNKFLEIKDTKYLKESFVGYLLLTEGLKKEYKIEEYPKIDYSLKPYLLDYPNIFFNISHSNGFVCVIISNEEVGIDVERIKNVNNKLILNVLNESEYLSILNEKDQNKAFLTFWTKKESYLKYKGCGLVFHDKLKNILNDKTVLFETQYIDDYVLTICKKNNN